MFLVYLYSGSLVVLLYFQICILKGVRVRNNYFDNSIRVVIRRDQVSIETIQIFEVGLGKRMKYVRN